MKEITLKIPDKDIASFLKVLQKLDYVEISEHSDIPEQHKDIVRDRIKKSHSDPNRLQPWDEARHTLNVKSRQHHHAS